MLKQLYLGGALLASWIVACSTTPSDDFACVPGQARCACKADHSCDDGLRCNGRDQCVVASAGTGGTNGDAGGSAGKGGSGKGGSGGDGGSTSQGGTPAGGTSNGGGATGGSSVGGDSAGTGGDTANGGGSGGSSTGGSGAGAGRDPGTGGAAGASGAADGGTGGAATGGTGGTGGDSGMGGTGPTCGELTIPGDMSYRNLSNAPDMSAYVYRTSGLGSQERADFLEVQFFASSYDPMDNGEQSGTFTLGEGSDGNLETCSRCVLVNEDYSQQDPGVVYFGVSGGITVEGEQHMTGNPAVELTDVTLREVTVDALNRHSTLVPNGRCLHLESLSVQIPADWSCERSSYAAGDGCDCGCGVRDGDCPSGDVSACDACHCGGSQSNCSGVSDTDNSVCQ